MIEHAVIKEKSILIRINRLYKESLSELQIFEATRGVWKIGEKRKLVKLAFAVFQGEIKEIYEIKAWHPAGTLKYETRNKEDVQIKERWEFDGSLADEQIRKNFIGKSVKSLFKKGMANPITYLNL